MLKSPMYIVASQSGNIVILVPWSLGISLVCLGSSFGENGTTCASISLIWLVSSDMYVSVVWLNVMLAMSVPMAGALVSGISLIAEPGFVARHTFG